MCLTHGVTATEKAVRKREREHAKAAAQPQHPYPRSGLPARRS